MCTWHGSLNPTRQPHNTGISFYTTFHKECYCGIITLRFRNYLHFAYSSSNFTTYSPNLSPFFSTTSYHLACQDVFPMIVHLKGDFERGKKNCNALWNRRRASHMAVECWLWRDMVEFMLTISGKFSIPVIIQKSQIRHYIVIIQISQIRQYMVSFWVTIFNTAEDINGYFLHCSRN